MHVVTLTPLQVIWAFFGAAFAFVLGSLGYMELSEYIRRERIRKKYMQGVRR